MRSSSKFGNPTTEVVGPDDCGLGFTSCTDGSVPCCRVIVEALLIEPPRRVRDKLWIAVICSSVKPSAFEEEIEWVFGQDATDGSERGRHPDILGIGQVDFFRL
jgi:hypothetical protein